MSLTKENDKKYIANTYKRFDLEIVRASGSFAYDDAGNEYIDLATGIAVNSFGACDGEWLKDVTEQLSLVAHTSNLYYTSPAVKLAQLLCERTGAKKVFFGNSGAEANECAIKVARKWGKDNKGEEYTGIITLKNSFHGRTITTLKATGQDVFHKDFGPFPDGFLYCEANNCEMLKTMVAQNKCCAIMMECVQGEGGVLPLDKEFVACAEALCRENKLLLIFDEVQTGNGRCGELYAYMTYGARPDIVSTAKGLGGGLPIGATLLFDSCENTLTYGDHGSTFGANPVCCAGALSIISRLDGALLAGVRERSKIIFDTLAHAEGVKSVTGLGLMIGIETVRDAGEVISRCMEKGVLVIKAKNKVRLLPPLNIELDVLTRALDVLKECLK
ncbi:MAG: aminotransferase class III-fold pyridoxal phosphate-dependent enzyme [Clostridia bacterium]|nr:aminotransferase class III-fold pyridoxal phosphate-dependent enzyme [Clostridia bacterium]